MLCAELRKKVLRFAVQPENSLRKHADFFDKVGSFVKKRGDFFVFVVHFFDRPHRVRIPTAAFERIVPHFSSFRFDLSIFTFTLRRFSSRGHAPVRTSRSRMRTSPSFDFVCSPFTSLLTNSYRECCGEEIGELCVKALQVKPSPAMP